MYLNHSKKLNMEKIKEDELRGFLNRIIQTTPELSERKIMDESRKSYLPQRSYMIVLSKYLRHFLDKSLNQRIILMPGLRGIGKTTLLFQLYRRLLKIEKIPQDRLLYIDAGELSNNIGKKLIDLFAVYEEVYLKGPVEKMEGNLFLFIDEAHYEPNWPAFVKSLFDRSDGKKNILIFVSGSSALALRTTTDLSRRAINDHLYPLSFQEYLLLKYDFYPPKGTAEKIRVSLNSDLESAYHVLSSTYNSLQANFTKSNINKEGTLINYLAKGASPLSLTDDISDLHFRWWTSVLEKVIQQDIPSFSPLSQKLSPYLFSLLQFLAQSTPSAQSFQSISQKLDGVSNTTVFNMFEALKNACLLVEIDPDVDPLKKTNVSSKYYFRHPTIRAALLWGIGKFKRDPLLNDPQILGILLEDIIASTLIKNREIGIIVLQVSFDSQQKGSDFIIKTPSGNIALEVGWGRKDSSQLKNSIDRFKCKFGILVDKTDSVSIKDKIITIPRELLLFI